MKEKHKAIFKGPTEILVLQNFAENWFNKYNVAEFSRDFRLHQISIRRALISLMDKDIIKRDNKRYCINKTSIVAYNFKLFYDSLRINLLDKEKKELIYDIYNNAKKFGLVSCIIFGSCVGKFYALAKDVDILLIFNNSVDTDEIITKRIAGKENINTLIFTTKEFEKQYFKGDDLILSILMRNLIFYDQYYFKIFLEKEIFMPSPEIISIRKEELNNIKRKLYDLIEIKDIKTLEKEYQKYLLKKARLLLIDKNIIPTTRPEIILEIRKYDKNLYNELKNPRIDIERVLKNV